MCRNITTLRGLDPKATPEEIEAGARQYVRKISGVQQMSATTETAFEQAVADIAEITTRLLAELPPRKSPPKTDPPLRRLAVDAQSVNVTFDPAPCDTGRPAREVPATSRSEADLDQPTTDVR